MGKRRKEETGSSQMSVDELSMYLLAATHDLAATTDLLQGKRFLDAARKAAAALESISNEYKVKLVGELHIAPFDVGEKHRSAHSHVANVSDTDKPEYVASVDYNASA